MTMAEQGPYVPEEFQGKPFRVLAPGIRVSRGSGRSPLVVERPRNTAGEYTDSDENPTTISFDALCQQVDVASLLATGAIAPMDGGPEGTPMPLRNPEPGPVGQTQSEPQWQPEPQPSPTGPMDQPGTAEPRPVTEPTDQPTSPPEVSPELGVRSSAPGVGTPVTEQTPLPETPAAEEAGSGEGSQQPL